MQTSKMGCDGGNVPGCANLGILTRDGRGTQANVGEARRLFDLACTGGMETACNDLGLTWADQAMAEPDRPVYFVLANKAFIRACEIGSPEGCSNLATDYYHGRGATQDYARAQIFGEKACKLLNANGCYTAGVMHLRGEGVPQNFAEWQSYVSLACNLGHAQACTNYGYMYLEGEWGVRQNLEKAREYLTRGRDGGYPPSAVDHEGEILESYVTKKRDKTAALVFLRKPLKRHCSAGAIVTDGLRSYPAAICDLENLDRRKMGRWLNNRVENSHLPFRRKERAMLRFRQMKTLQKFASVHANVNNHLNLDRHRTDRHTYKTAR